MGSGDWRNTKERGSGRSFFKVAGAAGGVRGVVWRHVIMQRDGLTYFTLAILRLVVESNKVHLLKCCTLDPFQKKILYLLIFLLCSVA